MANIRELIHDVKLALNLRNNLDKSDLESALHRLYPKAIDIAFFTNTFAIMVILFVASDFSIAKDGGGLDGVAFWVDHSLILSFFAVVIFLAGIPLWACHALKKKLSEIAAQN